MLGWKSPSDRGGNLKKRKNNKKKQNSLAGGPRGGGGGGIFAPCWQLTGTRADGKRREGGKTGKKSDNRKKFHVSGWGRFPLPTRFLPPHPPLLPPPPSLSFLAPPHPRPRCAPGSPLPPPPRSSPSIAILIRNRGGAGSRPEGGQDGPALLLSVKWDQGKGACAWLEVTWQKKEVALGH